MKFRLLPIFFLLAVCAPTVGAKGVQWFTDLTVAKKEAQKKGKPLLLDFTASWCGPCRAMEREFWVREDVVELSENFVCVKIDSDKNADLRRKYGVRGIPHITLTDVWGLELAAHSGYRKQKADQIVSMIASVPNDFGEVVNAGNLLETNPNDLSSLAAMAGFYQQRKLFRHSNEFYLRIRDLEKDPERRQTLLLNLGFNYLNLGKISEAEDIFQNFRLEFPKSKYADLALHGEILTLLQMKKIAQAEKLFDQLKSEFPGSAMLAQASLALSNAKLP